MRSHPLALPSLTIVALLCVDARAHDRLGYEEPGGAPDGEGDSRCYVHEG